MNFVFYLVYSALLWISTVTHLSYQEINIIVYYFVVPAAFFFLLDHILKSRLFTLSFLTLALVAFLAIQDFSALSNWLFERSVAFLLGFSVVGWNYTVASVVICVIVPGLVFIPLVHFAFPSFYRRHFPTILSLFSRH